MAEDFSSYQDPERARKIWNSYKNDIKGGLGGLRRARTLLAECRTSDELEVRLDLLLIEIQSGHSMKYAGKSAPVDSDSDGSLGNSTRLLEGD
jgi:hypothetical protein